MNKKLTIITINFNNLEGLKKTFKSIFSQTYTDFEYIVIDGGSTDGSKEYIEQHADKITYWVSEKDKGVYNAMNKGILKATGEYLNFMNSGDTFYNDLVFEKVYKELDDYDIVYGNTKLVYNYKKVDEIPPSKLSFKFLMDGGVNHQAIFFKRTLFKSSFMHNEDYKISADWEFLVYNICIKSARYKKLNLFICYYDKYGMSSSKEYYQDYLKERQNTKDKYFNYFIEYVLNDEISFEKRILDEKRVKQFLYIKNNKPIRWKILKLVLNILKAKAI